MLEFSFSDMVRTEETLIEKNYLFDEYPVFQICIMRGQELTGLNEKLENGSLKAASFLAEGKREEKPARMPLNFECCVQIWTRNIEWLKLNFLVTSSLTSFR